MKKIAIIIRCVAMVWALVLPWLVATGVALFEKKERPLKAVGWNGNEIIYDRDR